MTSVAIIIVHFNTEAETKDCLDSLHHLKRNGLNVHTYVLDNGSKEQLAVPESTLPPNTKIIRSDANLGFTNGNNLAISVAIKEVEPEYIVLLNNDTTVSPDFLQKLVAVAKADPKAGMIVPKIYFSEGLEYQKESYSSEQKGKVLWFGGGSIDWANLDAFHRGVDEVDRGQFDQRQDTQFATGCCVLIPRSVLDRAGMLDPRYFLYLEDVDWSLRIYEAGYELRFVPEAVIWHKNAGSSGGSGSPLHKYYQTRNRLFFFFKYAHLKYRSSGTRLSIKNVLQLLWFYVRVIKLGFVQLTSSDPILRRAAADWMIGRMGKQPVF
jgi:GT2 family glycosyltransferase